MRGPIFTVAYNGNEHKFEYGAEAYIFDTGVYHDIDEKYGAAALMTFTRLVFSCYLKDSNRTPLGALADYVAEHWNEVKDLGRYDILERFYLSEG